MAISHSKSESMVCAPGSCVSERDLRRGMTAELRYRPSSERYLLPAHWGKPRTNRGAGLRPSVYTPFTSISSRLHRQPVVFEVENTAESPRFGARLAPPTSLHTGHRFSARGALDPEQQQHCTRSAAFHSRRYLSNAKHHSGGQL